MIKVKIRRIRMMPNRRGDYSLSEDKNKFDMNRSVRYVTLYAFFPIFLNFILSFFSLFFLFLLPSCSLNLNLLSPLISSLHLSSLLFSLISSSRVSYLLFSLLSSLLLQLFFSSTFLLIWPTFISPLLFLSLYIPFLSFLSSSLPPPTLFLNYPSF